MRIQTIALGLLLVALTMPAVWAEKDGIKGTWLTDEGKARVKVEEQGGKYTGKIIWLKEPNYPDGTDEAGQAKHDRFNPEKSKRDRPIVGLRILDGFRYKGDNEWADGTIYDPENGKTYSCKIKRKGDKLEVRGFIGFSLLGRTTVWTRYVADEDKEGDSAGPAQKSSAKAQVISREAREEAPAEQADAEQ